MLTDVVANKEAALTVLAPTNSAFDAIPAADLEAVLADKEALTAVRSTLSFCSECVSACMHACMHELSLYDLACSTCMHTV